MPKTTAHGWGSAGTNALDPAYQADLERQAAEQAAPKDSVREEGASSPGSSSPRSTGKPGSSSAKKAQSGRPRARTTEQSSSKDLGESGSAAGTAGSGKADR